jgi:hypothetical protein
MVLKIEIFPSGVITTPKNSVQNGKNGKKVFHLGINKER